MLMQFMSDIYFPLSCISKIFKIVIDYYCLALYIMFAIKFYYQGLFAETFFISYLVFFFFFYRVRQTQFGHVNVGKEIVVVICDSGLSWKIVTSHMCNVGSERDIHMYLSYRRLATTLTPATTLDKRSLSELCRTVGCIKVPWSVPLAEIFARWKSDSMRHRWQ